MSQQVFEARRSLGRIGAHIPSVGITHVPTGSARVNAVQRLERSGFPAAWTNEGVGGKDVFVTAAGMLAASENITLGTDVANIWARAPQVAHAASTQLADAYPGRFVLGLGVGYPFQAAQVDRNYEPLAAMREYLTKMEQPPPMDAPLDAPYARVVAANGPKMLRLAAECADGALPALSPPASTASTRTALGSDRLLVVALTVCFDEDRSTAKVAAQEMLAGALSFPGSPYAANLIRLGFGELEVRSAAETVLDSVIAYGDASDISRMVEEHLAAGADHVVLQPAVGSFEQQLAQLEMIAPGIEF